MTFLDSKRISSRLQSTFGISVNKLNECNWQKFSQQLKLVCVLKKATTDDYICSEGTSADYVYLPLEGIVQLERIAFNGKRQVFAFLFTGNLIGLTAGTNFNFSARCLNDCIYIQIPKKTLDILLVEFPEVGQRYRDITQKALAKILDQMFVLGQMSATQKLAHFLLDMSNHPELMISDNELMLPMQRIEICDFLGITLETTSRIFTELKKKNYIVLINSQHIKLINKTALAQLIEL